MAIVKRLASEDYVSSKATEVVDVALDEHVVSWNDLEDKPFYNNLSQSTLVENVSGSWMRGERPSVRLTDTVTFTVGSTYRVVTTSTINNVTLTETQEVVASSEYELNITIQGYDASVYEDMVRMSSDYEKAGSINISIYEVSGSIKQLDEVFIPDTIARTSDLTAPKTELILVSSTSGSAKQFKITIDDEGVITATEIVETEA